MTNPSSDSLAAVLRRHAIELPSDQVELLGRYCHALWQWNTRLNLTRHTDYERFVSRDVVDSLWLERFLEVGERVLDVGSGGGVPGVVLAIVRPDLQVELTESVGKKAKALSAIVAELGLSIPVHHAAAQDVVADRWHDTLTIRAVAPLRKLLSWFAPHWNNIGRILLIKGPAWIEERGDARHRGLLRGLQLRRLAGYPLIDSQNESVVLQISPEER